MKKLIAATTALIALPLAAQAQSLQPGGFYIGAEGGVNWLLNTSTNVTVSGPGFLGNGNANISASTGWTAGGMIGYDFIGPRVELEARFIQNTVNVTFPSGVTGGGNFNQVPIMANLLYDFNAGGVIVPYIGAGLGVAFQNLQGGNFSNSGSSAQFAYQGIIGLGWNIDQTFRLNLEGRYFGTTQPNYTFSAFNSSASGNFSNNNLSIMASLQIKFGAPEAAPPPPPAPPVASNSFMVFFDWDRSNLSSQALATIQQAANAFKSKGNARITATGHTDKSGPENYNMALSLRRANAVKDALVRDGVPATAISVIGKGESQPLVQTADGVREPQNRRVEIVLM